MHSHHFVPGVYRATCVYVHEATLFDFFVDLGFNHYTQLRVRLRGVAHDDALGKTRGEKLKAEAAKKFSIQMLHPPSIANMVHLDYWPIELRQVEPCPHQPEGHCWLADVFVYNGGESEISKSLRKALLDNEFVGEA